MIAVFLFDNPRILILTIVTIIIAGLVSLWVMPRIEDPVLGRRVAVVSTVFPSASADQVESLVTIPLEEQLTRIAEIKQVRSNIRAGISNIVIELDDDVNQVDAVWARVQKSVDEVTAELPESCFPPKLEVFPLKAFAAIVSVRWKSDTPNLSLLRRLCHQLRAKVLEINGTESVDSFGDPGEELVVEFNPITFASLGISAGGIARQVVESNTMQPTGGLRESNALLPVDMKGKPFLLDHLSDVQISFGRRGESIPLADIATVRKQIIEPVSTQALVDGRQAIVLGALVSDDQQIDRWTDQLETVVGSFESNYSDEVAVDFVFLQRQHINQRMLQLVRNLAIGTVAVVAVVFLLMGWRSMLVVGVSLPLSALLVVVGLRGLSIPIHQMSVTGLIVALGLLIDNAIVIVEDVRSRIINGDSPREAIAAAVQHLAVPLFGSTLTTTFAFWPIATLPGPAGEFVGTIAISVILAISVSFALAMTVIPALNGLMRIRSNQRGWFNYGLRIDWLRSIYEASLRLVFRFPVLGVSLGICLPAFGFSVARALPLQFFPPSDRSQIQIEVEGPARGTMEGTQTTVETVRRIVDAYPDARRQYWFLGNSAPTFFYNVVPRRRGTPFYAQALVEMREGLVMEECVGELQQMVDQRVFDSRVIVRQLEQGPPFDAPIEIRLFGPDLATLQRLGSELRLLLSQTPNVIHSRSDVEETVPKLSLQLDSLAAKKSGLTESDIAAQLYTTLQGAPAGRIFDGGEELPIRISTVLEGDSKLNILGATQFPSPAPVPLLRRTSVPGGPAEPIVSNPSLASLSNFELDSNVGAIVRINGRRVNEVKAYLKAGVLTSVALADFKQRLSGSEFALPAGYSLQLGGEAEQRTNAVNSLIANAVVLCALMVFTLVASFRSFRCALIVAAVGGLSIGLGPLSLAIFGYPFGFMAIVGTMGLVGVAINDSIVVLAAIRASRGASDGDVLQLTKVVSACTRHIIATSLTTMVGFLPLILGGGGFWPPLAITIAGGVGGATILALYFVPALYLLLYGKRRTAV